MFIDIYNKFSCKYMKFINKYKKIVCKFLNWLEFQIPAFRAFCKTAASSTGTMVNLLASSTVTMVNLPAGSTGTKVNLPASSTGTQVKLPANTSGTKVNFPASNKGTITSCQPPLRNDHTALPSPYLWTYLTALLQPITFNNLSLKDENAESNRLAYKY